MTHAALVATAVLAAALAALARPQTEPRTMSVYQALNRTTCPFEVIMDVDEDRVPTRIKTIRCLAGRNKWCSKQGVPQNECCEHRHADKRLECVEIHDTVPVFFRSSKELKHIEVAVGCTCMIETSSEAVDVS